MRAALHKLRSHNQRFLQLPHLLMALTLLAVLAAALLRLHKVRKVHKASFRVIEHSRRVLGDLAETKRETLSLFRQLQALNALERRLGLPDPLRLMRGWAGSPDFLLCLANKLLAILPLKVMECSSGVSTVVAARCMQLNGHGHVYSPDPGEFSSPALVDKRRSVP